MNAESKHAQPKGIHFWVTLWLTVFFGFQPAHGEMLPDNDYYARTMDATAALQQWYGKNGLWDTTGWWNAANCVVAVENAVVAGNGRRYVNVICTTFERNSSGNFLNNMYDDEGWWALAWIRAYDVTGDVRYLKMARTIFADLTGGWDKERGGIWWDKQRTYKNAIPNELFLTAAIRLHQRTASDDRVDGYYAWAVKEWTWFKQSGMINSANLVNDGLNEAGQNNGQATWTYNQGVILGALTDLYKTTGDSNYLKQAKAIADAATASLVDVRGILREPGNHHSLGKDLPQFKGVFMQNLAYLQDEVRDPAYLEFLRRNAVSIWNNNRDRANCFGYGWDGPVDATDAARQSSALMAISVLAEPLPATFLDMKSPGRWTAASLKHEVGRAEGKNGWEADPVREATSGYLVKGLCVTKLPAGVCCAQFELKVDNFMLDRDVVATLSVVDNATGDVAASRQVARNEFPDTLFHCFELNFSTTAGRSYDFQTFWHYARRAPRLTERNLVATRATLLTSAEKAR